MATQKQFLLLASLLCFFSVFGQNESKIENLGKSVNSVYGELAPVITPDGKTLYFVRDGHPDNKCNQAIWFSTLQEDNTWSVAQRMGKPFNRENNNSINSVSADGNTLLLPNAYVKGGYVGKGYSFSHRTKKGWSDFQSIGLKGYSKMAKGRIAFANLSADGQKIVMCYSASGDDSDNDIFISFKEEKGWSIPTYLGNVVNTKSNEITPFLAPDGITLYFSSNRTGGYGKYDIYMTKRLDNTYKRWTTPVNLGPEFNTANSEAYYTLDAKGEYAYLASTHNAVGKQDIVRVKLKKEVKPNPVVLVEGKILDEKGKPVEATIRYEVLPSGQFAGEVNSNPQDGTYKIVLPYGNQYGYTVESEDHFPVSANIDLTTVKEYKEIKTNFDLAPVKKGEVVRVSNLFFGNNSDVLLPASQPELKRLLSLMTKRKKMVIEIGGHTDNVGGDAYNQKLSQKRAEAVRNFLIENGVNAERVSAKGYGEEKPIANNDTPEGKAANRRVEFTVMKK